MLLRPCPTCVNSPGGFCVEHFFSTPRNNFAESHGVIIKQGCDWPGENVTRFADVTRNCPIMKLTDRFWGSVARLGPYFPPQSGNPGCSSADYSCAAARVARLGREIQPNLATLGV